MYCVYLTIYRGNKNKMPPFYIGSSSVKKVKNGYRGTVSSKKWKETWKSELKDNPYLFETKIVCVQHTRQESLDKEYKFQKQLNVIKNSLYINQAIAAKNGFFGKDQSGKLNPNFGKFGKDHHCYGKQFSNERKLKESLSKIGELNPMFGKIRITDGVVNKTINPKESIPTGWRRGMTANHNST